MQKILNKTIERLLYDPWVRSGRKPSRVFLYLFSKVSRSRLSRVSENHLFSRYQLFEEQTSSFSFSRNSLIWLFARLQKTKPQSILEMGTGISSLAHAIYSIESPKPVSITSIDHDAGWLEVTQNMLLKRDRLRNLVDFRHCKIIESNTRWGQGYELPDELNDYYDWVLIDGPPAQFGRSFTLPSIWERLSPGANIFLDDADREGERKSTAEWLSAYPDLKLKAVLPLNKGLAWFRKCK
jgi:predicted O-methyltransferase YrrM